VVPSGNRGSEVRVSQQNGGHPGIDDGFVSSVEYKGQSYHVQTQCSTRDAPVVESLVFRGGEVLVRVTSSYAEVADQVGFTEDDGKHLLELQHADLVRKIRHGMLRNDDTTVPSEEAGHPDVEGMTVDPAEIDDAAVRELIQDLGEKVGKIAAPRPVEERRREPPSRQSTTTRRRRRSRFAIVIVLPF